MQGPPLWQRVLAALAYLLPWSQGVEFGRSLFGLFPPLQWLMVPVLPLAVLENMVPFGGFLLFLLVVRNSRVPYLIRFNVLQAILIDIVLILLALAFELVLRPLGAGFALRTLENAIFLGTLLLVLFGLVESLRGREADIPTVSEAVRMQLQ